MKKIIVWILIGVTIMTLAIGHASTNNFVEDVKQYIAYGWMEEPEARTWTFDSIITTASANVYKVNVNEDVTGLIGPNLKVRLSNPTVKYFGVLSVGAYAGGVTPVYLFGGTDYVLDGGQPITDVAFSNGKAPFGFPLSEDKWKIEITDTTTRTDGAPSVGNWSNVGSTNAQIILPAGLWKTSYLVEAGVLTTSTSPSFKTTLSTTSTTETYPSMTRHAGVGSAAITNGSVYFSEQAEDTFLFTTDTPLYLNMKSDTTGVTQLQYLNVSMEMIIRAVWGGL